MNSNVCVCVCERERERQRDRETERDRKRERETERKRLIQGSLVVQKKMKEEDKWTMQGEYQLKFWGGSDAD